MTGVPMVVPPQTRTDGTAVSLERTCRRLGSECAPRTRPSLESVSFTTPRVAFTFTSTTPRPGPRSPRPPRGRRGPPGRPGTRGHATAARRPSTPRPTSLGRARRRLEPPHAGRSRYEGTGGIRFRGGASDAGRRSVGEPPDPRAVEPARRRPCTAVPPTARPRRGRRDRHLRPRVRGPAGLRTRRHPRRRVRHRARRGAASHGQRPGTHRHAHRPLPQGARRCTVEVRYEGWIDRVGGARARTSSATIARRRRGHVPRRRASSCASTRRRLDRARPSTDVSRDTAVTPGRSRGCRSSSSSGSARARSAGCCSPTSAPRCCASTASRSRAPSTTAAPRRTRCTAASGRSASTSSTPDGVETFLRLVEQADAMIDVFRPGVAERLGIGPDACLAAQPAPRLRTAHRLGPGRPVRARRPVTTSTTSRSPARSSRSAAPGQPPTPPINVARRLRGRRDAARVRHRRGALFERERTGQGQVIDAAMVDGAALMLTPFFGARASGFWGERGTNLLDTGAPFYEVYETADGEWIAVGAIEPQFYAALLAVLGLDAAVAPRTATTRRTGPRSRTRFAEVVPHPDARRVVRARRRHRRVRRPGADARRGAPTIRTTWPARPSSSCAACPSPRPRPASRHHLDPTPAPPRAPRRVDRGGAGELGLHADDVEKLRAAGVLV